MKKTIKILLAIFTFVAIIPTMRVNALSDSNVPTYEEIMRVGNEYARLQESKQQSRMDGEVWEIVESKCLLQQDTLKAKFGDIVETGASISKTLSWSLSAGTKIGKTNITLTNGISGSVSCKRSASTEKQYLYDGTLATHRAFFAIVEGSIYEYKYEVRSKYSNTFLRYETAVLPVNIVDEDYSQLISKNGTNVTVENAIGTKKKTVAYTTYKNQFSKTGAEADDYYYW